MKIRRSVLLCALVAILVYSGGSASAEERPGGSISTSLTGTTISASGIYCLDEVDFSDWGRDLCTE